MTCVVCRREVDPLDVHWLHRPDCVEGCGCERPVHPACCPDCAGEEE